MTQTAERHAFLEPRITRKAVSGYASLGEIASTTARRIFTPPESINVSQAAEKYVQIDLAGAWSGFDNSTAPYMVEPMNMTQSREHSGLVFVSSAQCGKTASLILNVVAYNVKVTGMDTMVVCQSSTAAGDFAVRRVDRMISNSPDLKGQILPVRNSDNQKRKQMKNGMLLTIAHPSKNELSGKPIGVVVITDYDRIADDIDGEGSAWGLGSKRTETFGSYAMTIAESSPSRPVDDTKKILGPHEAPDCKGILALYNQGDRRMWYWACPSCDEYFSPEWKYIGWDEKAGGHLDQAETAYMRCPHCDHHIQPEDRHEMQQWGYWKAAEGRRSSTVSYWLDGTAAAFSTWPKLVERYLDAQKTFEDTGDESGLVKFWNTDLGRPYVPKSQESVRTPEELMSRATFMGDREPACPAYAVVEVPADVRMLLACVDVQKNMFVVQVHGIKRGVPADMVIVDRFSIWKSTRDDGSGDRDVVKPHAMQEDWELLVKQVILRTYPLSDGSGRQMQVKLTLCDSGGAAMQYDARATGSGGVTEKAYNFWRELNGRGLGARFHLVRGSNTRMDKRAWIKKPDANEASGGKYGAFRGDIPVLYFNANEVKDVLSNRLDVMVPGAGLIEFPNWLPAWFYGELCAEYYETGKGWKNPKGRRNEAWDLLYYAIGVTFSPLLPLEKIDWDRPPAWLRPWNEDNPFVLPAPEHDTGFAQPQAFERRAKIDFAALARSQG